MTRREIAVVACKVLALWMIAQGVFFACHGLLLFVITAIGSMTDHARFGWDEMLVMTVTSTPGLAMLVVGILVWLKAPWLGRRMVGDDPTPVTRSDITSQSVMSITCAGVGVFLLVPTLRDLAGDFILISKTDVPFSEFWRSANWHADFWSTILQLVLALWLILGSRGVVKLFRWSRTAGIQRSE